MKKRHMAAALVLPLVLKAPAQAQGPADGRSEFRIASGPSIGGTVDARSPYLPLGGVGSGVRIASTPIIQQDGSAVFRNVLVGGWAMSPRVKIGVGLIEVNRMSHKVPALRRIDPMRDTRPERDRIAAIGINIDF